MSDIIPIVTIKTANGPVDINMVDYDPKVHTLADGKESPEFAIGKNGKRGAASKFIILDKDGETYGEDEFDTLEQAEEFVKQLNG